MLQIKILHEKQWWNMQWHCFLPKPTIHIIITLILFININSNGVNANGNLNNNKMNIQSTTPMAAPAAVAPSSSIHTNESIKITKLNIVNNNINNNNNNNNFTSSSNNKSNWQFSSLPLRMGNELWDNLITDCYQKPSFSCFQKNAFIYLNNTLDIKDINITSRLSFYENNLNYNEIIKQDTNTPQQQQQHKQFNSKATINNNQPNPIPINNNKIDDSHQDHDNDGETQFEEESRSAKSPLEEVTNALYSKTVKFAMTHDVDVKLPEMMFDGAIFRISPRSIEGNGAIVKLELIPKTEIQARDTGRIFKKKIFGFLKNKVLLSFLAILLIIKLIKIKFFWLLPIIIGVGAAKKFLLKILLFLFPALAHIFKLCNYYHSNYHQTKYHHHHHLINHHHTTSPAWFGDNESHYTVAIPNGPELIFTQPPKGHPHEYINNNQHQPHQHYDNGWEASGPGLGSEYISDSINRNGQIENGYFKPKLEDANDIQAWGLGNILSGTNHNNQSPSPHHVTSAVTSHNFNPFVSEQPSSIINKSRLNHQHGPIYSTNPKSTTTMTAAQIAAQYDPQINQQHVKRTQAQVKEALRIQTEQRLVSQQQKILQQQPFVQDGQPLMPKGYDPFYSPILIKMDSTFHQLGFTDDHCKERLVCSMYKNPNRYSPHSNFISAELSRDTSELQKPSDTNQSVMKFYKLVQAARDGQEQRDCLRLYPQCSINTE